MPRTFTVIAALAALSLAAPAFADAGGPYKLDAKGKCHDAKGAFAKTEKCSTMPMSASSGGKCRDKTTKAFAKCGAANTEPVPAKTSAMSATSSSKSSSKSSTSKSSAAKTSTMSASSSKKK